MVEVQILGKYMTTWRVELQEFFEVARSGYYCINAAHSSLVTKMGPSCTNCTYLGEFKEFESDAAL